MSIFITLLFAVTAVLLIAVVLIQQPKTSGGLFSGTGQSLLGTGGKTFWTKFTIVLAAVFMGLCLLMALFPKYDQPKSSVADIIEKQQQAAQQPAVPSGVTAAPKAEAKPAAASVPASPKSAPAPAAAPVKGKK